MQPLVIWGTPFGVHFGVDFSVFRVISGHFGPFPGPGLVQGQARPGSRARPGQALIEKSLKNTEFTEKH